MSIYAVHNIVVISHVAVLDTESERVALADGHPQMLDDHSSNAYRRYMAALLAMGSVRETNTLYEQTADWKEKKRATLQHSRSTRPRTLSLTLRIR